MLRPPSFFKSITPSEDKQPQTFQFVTDHISTDPQISKENVSKLENQIHILTSEHDQNTRLHSIQIQELNEQITQQFSDIEFLKKAQNDRKFAFTNEKNDLEREYIDKFDTIHAENETHLSKINELENIITEQQQYKQEIEQQIYAEKEENIRLKQSLNSIVSYPEREKEYTDTIAELNTQVDYNLKQILFLNLRLESLQDILKIQERNVTQNSDESVGNLLTAWRGKVFELLMRSKFSQIETESSAKHFAFESNTFKDKISKLENETELQKLCINERSAQVDSLCEDITVITARNNQLSICINSHESLQTLFNQSAQNSFSQMTKLSSLLDNFNAPFVSKITLLQHRITFLKDRIGFLVDYFRDNQSRLKPSCDQAVQTNFPNSCLNHIDSSREGILSLTHGTLANEIQMLVRERSILRNKMKENSDISKQEIQQIKQQSNIEIEKLQNDFEQIQKENIKICQENVFSQNELEKLQKTNQENENKIQNLEANMFDNNVRYEQERKLLRQNLQETHSESLNELENRLNEVNQNYSELQHQLNEALSNAQEQKELAIGNLKIENQDLQRKLEETRLHLQAMEAEKNTLSISLRNMQKLQPIKLPEHSIEDPLPTSTPELLTQNIPETIDTAPIDSETYNLSNEIPTAPKHTVPASELFSMVQELTQLSSQIFSL
ncbi:hypothetical protein LOD99_13460 [Oopsacas minuta]|uniref:Coiled-coil alpha-helical rod protein 1 n=1 Tax=Oopsacas minuta TaxID=111878 RepID=A0AAV7KJI0_9METZ|nr:hypothetical protein LOD99_13460 [Oopsacas minuta]